MLLAASKNINKSLLDKRKCSFLDLELGVLYNMIKPIFPLLSSFSSLIPIVLQSEMLQILPQSFQPPRSFCSIFEGLFRVFKNLSSPSTFTSCFPMNHFLTSHPFFFIPRLVRISVSLNSYKHSCNSKVVISFLLLPSLSSATSCMLQKAETDK